MDRSRELRDQREKDRHLRSSTTRALAGTATGARLKDPIGAMAPSPVGNVGKFTVCSAQGKSPIRMIRMILGGGGNPKAELNQNLKNCHNSDFCLENRKV